MEILEQFWLTGGEVRQYCVRGVDEEGDPIDDYELVGASFATDGKSLSIRMGANGSAIGWAVLTIGKERFLAEASTGGDSLGHVCSSLTLLPLTEKLVREKLAEAMHAKQAYPELAKWASGDEVEVLERVLSLICQSPRD